MKKTGLIIVGGFLGAGKTTCILNMAKYFTNNLKKVGIVTNDQGNRLVDTSYLRSEGLSVLEVTGGCFCCNFDEFVKKAESLAENQAPDIILAEPVGSCTDLIATIYKPMQAHNAFSYDLCPLCIMADPKRVRKLLKEEENGLFPNEINYLFRKQLEEADIILLNKVDTLEPEERDSLLDFLRKTFRSAVVVPVSANEIQSVGEVLPFIVGARISHHKALDVNYDIYGRAEEMLGWLNLETVLESCGNLDWNSFITGLMEGVRKETSEAKGEIAHLKIYAVSDKDHVKASLTGLEDDICFNGSISVPCEKISLIVNARIGIDPAHLGTAVDRVLHDTCRKWGVSMSDTRNECFKPGWPNPKYRMV